MPRCLISLGGNSGPVAATFELALSRLQQGGQCRVAAVSRNYATAAVGDQAGAKFLNAAAELETALAPLELLDWMHNVELELGRIRATHWGPRTLDVDLLFWESQIIDTPRLIVPHPAAWYRRFVLDPLAEIAAAFVHPVKRVTIGALRERLLVRPLRVSFAGSTQEQKAKIIGRLAANFPTVSFSDWDCTERNGAAVSDPALIFWLGPRAGGSSTDSPATAQGEFERLPLVPRIDSTAAKEPQADFVRYVVQSALGS